MEQFLTDRIQNLLINDAMLENRNCNVLLNFNHDKDTERFIGRWTHQMSYQKTVISRLRGNVNLIKDEMSRNGVYYKNIETSLWTI